MNFWDFFEKCVFFRKIRFDANDMCMSVLGFFQPFPIAVGLWNNDMLLLTTRAWVTTFQNPERSKVMGARSKKVIFSKIGTPPSVFELEFSNFQNVEIFLWPKNCRKPNFEFLPNKNFLGVEKWSKFWTFLLFKLGPSNYCCL